MTALKEYARLEATGLWRAAPDAQRREVFVSLGDATLTIAGRDNRALAHWSLAAVARANPGQRPAIYHPDGDPGETLEIAGDEEDMIAAIEKLRRAIERRRPRPGRLRLVMAAGSVAAVVALAVFWVPDALREHTVSVVPKVKRAEIGQALLTRLHRVAGQPCSDAAGLMALAQLDKRVLGKGGGSLVVLRSGVRETTHLPGGTILLNRALVEDPEEPDVVAGYVLAEALRARARDPLDRLLARASLMASFRLLTTGRLTEETLDDYAEYLLTAPAAPLTDADLLAGFAEARLRATPYAYARDVSGETTLGLIEADPFAADPPRAVLSDGDWLRLQGICGG